MLATILLSGADGMLGGTGGNIGASLFGAEKSFLTVMGVVLAGVASFPVAAVLTTTGVGFAGAGFASGAIEISSGCRAGVSVTG